MLTKAPRGTKDILPADSRAWQFIENKIRNLCARYGYEEIRTPTFEHTELFQRSIGEKTDVVDKEMYTFTDRGNRSVTLRPENTASVVRAYLENKLYGQKNLNKLYYIGSMFRYDRPQAGRMREFHQFGVEALGESNPLLDSEIIMLARDFLRELSLHNLTVSLNSVGCPNCRPLYREKLRDYFRDKLDGLCHDCQDRFERNPMRILDCKADSDKDFMAAAPAITECLCDECAAHFAAVRESLRSAGVEFTLDSRLVRGLDYYTRTAFEIKCADLGAQSAVAGGGRYDKLVEEIGGPATPAVGFAVGLERVLLLMDKQNLSVAEEPATDVFVVSLDKSLQQAAFALAQELRRSGIRTMLDYGGHSLKAQMREANRLGAPYAVLLGENEMQNNRVTLKDMAAGEQEQVPRDNIGEILAKKLEG